jgi:hypothetical protein
MPGFSLFLGLVMLGAFWIGGDLGQGLFSLGVMAFVAALFFFGARRSEALAGIGGPARDERWERIDVHALGAHRPRAGPRDHRRLARRGVPGKDGTPYVQLGAVGGVAYVAAVAFLRRRS